MYFVMRSSITATVTSSMKNVPFGRRKIEAIISMPFYVISGQSYVARMPNGSEDYLIFANTYTNTIMNNRLMKYIASTRPTVKKKYVRALFSTSG